MKLVKNFGTLNISTFPDSCNIYIDGKKIGHSPLQDYQISNGKHQLILEAADYEDFNKEITIAENKPANLDLELTYSYGMLFVKSLPEDGATVFIDDIEVGVTPYANSRQDVGNYSVRIAKEFWTGSEMEIEVKGSEKCEKDLILTPNFSDVKIVAVQCDIYIDGQKVGFDSITKRLEAGKYLLEARLGDHLRDYKEIFCVTGENNEVTLKPQAQYASLTVLTTPQQTEGAEVFINKKLSGTTPMVSKVQVGRNDMVIKHPLYITMKKSIELDRAEQQILTFEMEKYKGSAYSKAIKWKRSKWISLAGAVLCSGAGVYCNTTGDTFLDDYKKSTTTASAMKNWDDADSWHSKRDIVYSVSLAPAAWFVYSWIKEAGYSKKMKR